MASVLPRGITRNGSLYVVELSYRGRKAKAIEPSLYAAEIKKGQLLDALVYGKSLKPPPKPIKLLSGTESWTLTHAYEQTCEHVWSHAKGSQHCMNNGRMALRYFGEDAPLAAITMSEVDTWIKSMRDNQQGNSTINRKLSALSKMMRFAISRGGLDHRPPIPRLKEPPGRTRIVTPEEEARIFRFLKEWDLTEESALIAVLLDTGMRISEVRHLKEKDIDLKARVIRIWLTKNDNPRSVPMTQRVYEILSSRSIEHGDNQFFPRTYTHYHLVWEKIRTAMCLRHDRQFVLHCLRHTCASRLVQNGVQLQVVKEWMGHRSFQMTLRYAHILPINLMQAVSALEPPKRRGVFKKR